MKSPANLLPLLCSGLFACAGDPHDTAEIDNTLQEPVEDPTLITTGAAGVRTADEQANLDRLAALEVFAVGNMLARYPLGAMNCYGVCPEFEDEVAAANVLAAERLEALVEHVESLDAGAPVDDGACEQAAIDVNLAALQALEVVEIGEFLAVVPQNNPNCYNLPCEEDLEAAEIASCSRATTLARIVDGL